MMEPRDRVRDAGDRARQAVGQLQDAAEYLRDADELSPTELPVAGLVGELYALATTVRNLESRIADLHAELRGTLSQVSAPY